MKKICLLAVITTLMSNSYAFHCDCEVRVFSPTTGSNQLPPDTLKAYQLESFSTYSAKNQNSCRTSCLETFEKDLPSTKLNSLLLSYAQNLIGEKILGYNCTGLTTLKFPVRVKATLGDLGLGNVADTIQVVSHEELCF